MDHPMTRPWMRSVALAVTLAVTGAAPAAAHHGWSGYDSSQVLEVTGTIAEAGYEHPHGFVKIQAPGKTWLVTLAPPSRMERRGLERTALAPGTKVTVVGYPSRTDPQEMRAERITLNGQTTELR
jgi:hypothetical protein